MYAAEKVAPPSRVMMVEDKETWAMWELTITNNELKAIGVAQKSLTTMQPLQPLIADIY